MCTRRKGPLDHRLPLQCQSVITRPFEVMSEWGAGDVGYVAIAFFTANKKKATPPLQPFYL